MLVVTDVLYSPGCMEGGNIFSGNYNHFYLNCAFSFCEDIV